MIALAFYDVMYLILVHVQEIHRTIEEEAVIQAKQPKKMKTFSESYKSEKNSSLVVGVKKPTPVSPAKEDAGEVMAEESKVPVQESPRNNKLKNLGTRGRGSRTEAKKSIKKYVFITGLLWQLDLQLLEWVS